jgi:malonate transporter MadL subunit
MKIYGVAILAACYLLGQLLGDVLGIWLKIDGNIGGVGFAMLFLILLSDWMKKKNYLDTEPEKGILFWSAMYIPVVIAMSATQNVKAAITGGWVAVIVGLVATGLCFFLIPLVSKIGINKSSGENKREGEL